MLNRIKSREVFTAYKKDSTDTVTSAEIEVSARSRHGRHDHLVSMSAWLNGFFSSYGTPENNPFIPLCCMGLPLKMLGFMDTLTRVGRGV